MQTGKILTKDQFIAYLKRPELLDEDSVSGLKEMIEDYPYFPAARILYLRNLRNINSYRFESELVKHALFIPDRKMLFRLLTLEYAVENEFQLLPFDKDAFSRFFDSEAIEVPGLELQAQSSYELPVDKINEEPLNESGHTDLIDKFISENPSITPLAIVKPEPVEEPPIADNDIDDGLITETLAGIYVKQGLYREALNAYQKLSLKFPEKNSYFASQIEKIKKLISKDL